MRLNNLLFELIFYGYACPIVWLLLGLTLIEVKSPFVLAIEAMQWACNEKQDTAAASVS